MFAKMHPKLEATYTPESIIFTFHVINCNYQKIKQFQKGCKELLEVENNLTDCKVIQ